MQKDDKNHMNNKLIQIARNILLEDSNKKTKIENSGASPDVLRFNNKNYAWDNAYAAFSFLGKPPGVLVYIKNLGNDRPTHEVILASFADAYYTYGTAINKIKPFLAKRGIVISKPLTIEDAKYAMQNQDVSNINELSEGTYDTYNSDENEWNMMKNAREQTFSGRVWKNLDYKNDKIDVIVFWCKENDIKKDKIDYIKNEFKLTNPIYWVCMDSKFFNEYGDKNPEVNNTEELHSKLYPKLSHNDILTILQKKHTNKFKLKDDEKNVLWELGYDPIGGTNIKDVLAKYAEEGNAPIRRVNKTSDKDLDAVLKKKLGGFKTIAQRNAALHQEEVEYEQ